MRKVKAVARAIVLICLLAAHIQPLWARIVPLDEKEEKPRSNKLLWRLSNRDMILPITSIEWGTPDRWSFTSRYIHELYDTREGDVWKDWIHVSLSPGTAGGRLSLGYGGVYSPPDSHEFGILTDARMVVLRTWGNPLSTASDLTFAGLEIRAAIGAILNLGVGYYDQISSSDGKRDSFYGFHVGVGI